VKLALRWAPLVVLIVVGAYVAAQQVVSPERRVVKLSVALGLVAMMFRFGMIWSVLLFTALFPFPSGISIGSTNDVLMTLIPLIWAVRASAAKTPMWTPTRCDWPIALFMFSYVVSLFSVSTTFHLLNSLRVIWRQIACLAYFYLIVRFVDSEDKLMHLFYVVCASAALVMVTALIEAFFPGRTIIPGWINLPHLQGQGRLAFRIKGVRVGGAVGSHALLSDYASNTLPVMVYLFFRARNPLTKLSWAGVSVLTLLAMLSSGNRGAFIGLAVGLMVLAYLLRRQVSPWRIGVAALLVVVAIGVSENFLTSHTYSTSVIQRLLGTRFEGVVPHNREHTWVPALKKSFHHFFMGHGPYYDIGTGLSYQLWPHNGYIFYLYTLGILGLAAFLWILWRLFGELRLNSRRGIEGTNLGNVLKLLMVWFVISALGQLRTDHQRDDIYPFLIWLQFGLIAAAGQIARKRIGEMGRVEELPGAD